MKEIVQQNQQTKALSTTLSAWPKEVTKVVLAKTVEEAIESTPVQLSVRANGVDRVRNQIEYELNKWVLLVSVGNKLEGWQLKLIADNLMKDHPLCSVDDFALAFERGCKGQYGKLFGIDLSVVYGWVEKYLEEKAIARENQLAKEKAKERAQAPADTEYPEISEETRKMVEDYMASLKQNHVVPRMTDEDIKVWGQSEPPKRKASSAGMQYGSQEQLIEFQLKQEWMRVCFDPITAQPLPSYVSFEEFKMMTR